MRGGGQCVFKVFFFLSNNKIKSVFFRSCKIYFSYTYNLFLSVLVGGEQVDRLHLTEVDVVAEQKDEEKFANIFLLLVTVQCLVALDQKCLDFDHYRTASTE